MNAAMFLLLYALLTQVLIASGSSSSKPEKNITDYDHLENIFNVNNIFSDNKLILQIHFNGIDRKTAPSDFPLNKQYVFNDNSTFKLTRSRKVKCTKDNCRNLTMELTFHWRPKIPTAECSICLLHLKNESVIDKWFTNYVYEFQNELSGKYDSNLVTSETPPFGPVIEPIFYHKDGFALILDDLHSWHAKFNTAPSLLSKEGEKTELCFSLNEPQFSTSIDHAEMYQTFKFKVLIGQNLKAVYESIVQAGYVKRLKASVSADVLQSPVFALSSLEQLKEKSDGTVVKPTGLYTASAILTLMQILQSSKLADLPLKTIQTEDIPKSLLKNNQFAFHQFNEQVKDVDGRHILQTPITKIAELMKQAHSDKTNLTIWVKPFFRTGSIHVSNHQKFFLKSGAFSEQLADLSNYEAFNWFSRTLESFVTSSTIDGLVCANGAIGEYFSNAKFDFELSDTFAKYPNFFTTKYNQACAASKSRSLFTTSVYKTQSVKQIVVIETFRNDDFTKSINSNAIKQMLKKVIRSSLLGYPLVMPKMFHSNMKPDKAWYNRWIQMAACMPVMHLPILPYKAVVTTDFLTTLTKLIQFRNNHIIPEYIKAIEEWIRTGEPVIRPMWYASPDDPKAYEFEDQFMIGNDLLVAPLTSKDSKIRLVYFPEGKWQQACYDDTSHQFTESNNVTFSSGFNLPIFKRIKNPDFNNVKFGKCY